MSADFHFAGFKNLNSTPIPDEFFDALAVNLSEAELRVLLYIMRRTFGFKKKADAISLNQLTGGIRRRDGQALDYGTGLSRPAVLKAVGGLQAKGIIRVDKGYSPDGRNQISVYSLRFEDEQALTQPPISYIQHYSEDEYRPPEHLQARPLPDPRPAPARSGGQRPVGEPAAVTGQAEHVTGQAGPAGQTGEGKVELPARDRGVNYVYYRGKAALPSPETSLGMGKAGLPGRVKPDDRAGKLAGPEGVNRLYRQHGSLQESSLQKSAEQVVLSQGALALQAEPEGGRPAGQLDINLELVTALTGCGLGEKFARGLAEAYPAGYLWEKIELTRSLMVRQPHTASLRNAAGYLRKAIEEDYRPQRREAAAAGDFQERFKHALAWTGPTAMADDPVRPAEIENYPVEAPLPPINRGRPAARRPAGAAHSQEPPIAPGKPNGPVPDRGAGGQAAGDPVADGLWQAVREALRGRYRLELDHLLEGSQLRLVEDAGGRRAVVRLRWPWQAHELTLAARSSIGLALRQQLGPGFTVQFDLG